MLSVDSGRLGRGRGHRAKHKQVPVLVDPELITDEVQREIDRIIDQLGENGHRTGIPDADEVRATQERWTSACPPGRSPRSGEIENLVHAAVKELKTAASKRPEQFDHIAQQWRDKLEEERICAELADGVEAQGVTVIERPASLRDGPARKLDSLRPKAEAADGTELTIEVHQGCRGHAAFIGSRCSRVRARVPG
jgi:ParB family chromosome partitioning protein